MHSRKRFQALGWLSAMNKFEESLAFGRAGESTISKWLQKRGHSVFPAYEKEGGDFKGPQLFSDSGDLVLPDLLAFRSGKAIWFEVKRKTCFTWHRISQRWVTGIDLHHYGQYQEVSSKTHLPVWLIFFHPESEPDKRDILHGCPPKSPTGLFGNDILKLRDCESHRHQNWGRHGMVYWPRENLRLLADTRDIDPRFTGGD